MALDDLGEVSQEYDCPYSCDFDLFEDRLVYNGKSFYCYGCGSNHVAGRDVEVHTLITIGDKQFFPDTPNNEEELAALIAGGGIQCR